MKKKLKKKNLLIAQKTPDMSFGPISSTALPEALKNINST